MTYSKLKENFMDQSLAGYSHGGHKESRTRLSSQTHCDVTAEELMSRLRKEDFLLKRKEGPGKYGAWEAKGNVARRK